MTSRTRTALGALALGASVALLPACSYSSEVDERIELPPLLVSSAPRQEDPDGRRRTTLAVERDRAGGLDRVHVEELELADFVTERVEQPRREVVLSASVNDVGAWWILPVTADATNALLLEEDWSLLGWVIVTPFTLVIDAVFGIPHILRMIGYELNEIEEDAPRDASVWERDVIVERRDLIAELDDPRLLVDGRAWLRPELGPSGAVLFDASSVAPLDGAPLPSLALVGRRHGSPLSVDLPWPAGWRETVLAERGLDMDDDVMALGGRAQVSVRRPGRVTPGVPATLSVVVSAQGSGDLCGLVGESSSRNPWLDGRVFNIGRLSPGQSARVDMEILLPDDLPASGERVTITFRSSRGTPPPATEVVIRSGLATPDR